MVVLRYPARHVPRHPPRTCWAGHFLIG